MLTPLESFLKRHLFSEVKLTTLFKITISYFYLLRYSFCHSLVPSSGSANVFLCLLIYYIYYLLIYLLILEGRDLCFVLWHNPNP